MKFEIETYKGQLIEYNDENDKFICDIVIEDKFKSTKRLSLTDVRKEIDTFIKLNVDFKPFKVLATDGWNNNNFAVLIVSAIRTDGKFVTYKEGNQDYKSYSGKKEMATWKSYDPDAVNEKNRLKKLLDEAQKVYNTTLNTLTSKLLPIDLSKYEHIINQKD